MTQLVDRPSIHHTLLGACLAAAALAGCATSSPAQSDGGPYVRLTYVAANNDLAMTNGPTAVATSVVQLAPSGADSFSSTGPYISTAAKCNADHSVCKHGVVMLSLKYTVSRTDAGWIIDGEMNASLSRSATAVTPSLIGGRPAMAQTRTLAEGFSLIDDEPVGTQRFHWKVIAGLPLELHGPAGSLIQMQQVPRP